MQTSELVASLDAEMRVDAFRDGQENGLQIEGTHETKRLATAVSVSQETIDAAVAWGADALLTHHGLLWHNQPLHVRGVRRKRLAAMLDAELNLISYHLPLDAHPHLGNNAALATAAGCTSTAPAFELKGQPIGLTGRLPAATLFTDWIASFETALRDGCTVQTGPFQAWPHGAEMIETVGFVSGAAPYQVQDAIDLGLDAYVTGEPTEGVYHLAKEAGIHFVAAGHYLSERMGVQRLGQWAAEQHGLEHRFFDAETLA